MTGFRDGEIDALLGLNALGIGGVRQVMRLRRAVGGLERLRGRVSPGRAQTLPVSRRLRELLGDVDLDVEGLRERRLADHEGCTGSIWGREGYPEALMHLANPPPVVWTRRGGGVEPPGPLVAIVGSRACSRYGLRTARALASGLAERGVVVVSGLARGVDTAAHRGALEVGGETWAVLGSGLAAVYPRENRGLAEEIARTGRLISEFGIEAPPHAWNFPRRNRIIAALAAAIIVVEARKKSGALITARWASELGREILVVPGQVDNPACEGVLALLRDGACPVRGAADVFEVLGLDPSDPDSAASSPSIRSTPLSNREGRVLAVLDHEPAPLDVILEALHEPVGDVLASLMSLEMKGRVEQLPGLRFRRP